jgi:phage FluMu protein Com
MIFSSIIVLSGLGMYVQFRRLGRPQKCQRCGATLDAPHAVCRACGFDEKQPGVTCPNYKNLNPFGSTYCLNCRLSFVSGPTIEVACPQCNHLNRAGTTYCGHCGYLLLKSQSGQTPCPQCKTLNQPGSAYCGSCGCALNEPAPQTQPLPVPMAVTAAQRIPLPQNLPAPVVICPKCQVHNPPGSAYCMACGVEIKKSPLALEEEEKTLT